MLFTGGLPDPQWYRTELNLSQNRYSNADNARSFALAVGSEKATDFKGWIEATGQEEGSVWVISPQGQ